jgi:hypothetical protein
MPCKGPIKKYLLEMNEYNEFGKANSVNNETQENLLFANDNFQ